MRDVLQMNVAVRLMSTCGSHGPLASNVQSRYASARLLALLHIADDNWRAWSNVRVRVLSGFEHVRLPSISTTRLGYKVETRRCVAPQPASQTLTICCLNEQCPSSEHFSGAARRARYQSPSCSTCCLRWRKSPTSVQVRRPPPKDPQARLLQLPWTRRRTRLRHQAPRHLPSLPSERFSSKYGRYSKSLLVMCTTCCAILTGFPITPGAQDRVFLQVLWLSTPAARPIRHDAEAVW